MLIEILPASLILSIMEILHTFYVFVCLLDRSVDTFDLHSSQRNQQVCYSLGYSRKLMQSFIFFSQMPIWYLIKD